jgi:two-component system, NarL family, response regulator DesR
MRLMIIDDHAGVRALIRQIVASPEDVVCECASGTDAVQLARDFRPEGATVDIRMPGLDGLLTARGLGAICPGIRIVIVTAFDQPELRHAATAVGAIGYVKKENLAELPALLRGVAFNKDSAPGNKGRPASGDRGSAE